MGWDFRTDGAAMGCSSYQVSCSSGIHRSRQRGEIVIQDGVDVTPSRESYMERKYQNYIQGAIERAAQDAANVIDKQLDEKDFMTWIRK